MAWIRHTVGSWGMPALINKDTKACSLLSLPWQITCVAVLGSLLALPLLVGQDPVSCGVCWDQGARRLASALCLLCLFSQK